jgi:hypothetical protein
VAGWGGLEESQEVFAGFQGFVEVEKVDFAEAEEKVWLGPPAGHGYSLFKLLCGFVELVLGLIDFGKESAAGWVVGIVLNESHKVVFGESQLSRSPVTASGVGERSPVLRVISKNLPGKFEAFRVFLLLKGDVHQIGSGRLVVGVYPKSFFERFLRLLEHGFGAGAAAGELRQVGAEEVVRLGEVGAE